MALYKFRLVDGSELYSKHSKFTNVLTETKTAYAEKLVDYLHYIFSNNDFLPLYNLYTTHPDYTNITYDATEKIVYMPKFYDNAKEYLYDYYTDQNVPFINILNENDKYTLEEIERIINYCIVHFEDLDSYQSWLELIIEPFIKCEVLNIKKK
jgi:hypothetical protein